MTDENVDHDVREAGNYDEDDDDGVRCYDVNTVDGVRIDGGDYG